MPTLLDVPTPDERLLLEVVAKCFHTAQDKWPVWQYVERQFTEVKPEVDAVEVLRGMPTWRHGYRYLRVDTRGGVGPEDGAEVRMTVAGIHHSGNGRVGGLVEAFIVALREAAKKRRSAEPEPLKAIAVPFTGSELTEIVHKVSGISIPTLTLSGMLEIEPATWHGLDAPGGVGWVWHLERVRLNQFRLVQTTEEYLAGLERIVGVPEATSLSATLPSMALPDALDHLNLVWRLTFKTPLMQLKRAATPALLTQSVNSSEEFESRCTALATIFDGFMTRLSREDSPDGQPLGTLAGMQATLRKELGDHAERAALAVGVLRDVNHIRTGQQHRERDIEAEQAKIRLGLASFGSDWSRAWEHLRHKIVEALRTIREELPA